MKDAGNAAAFAYWLKTMKQIEWVAYATLCRTKTFWLMCLTIPIEWCYVQKTANSLSMFLSTGKSNQKMLKNVVINGTSAFVFFRYSISLSLGKII
jgi:O-acetylhomoserine/O-acetylserine sulfhydrylase-like pyridoxal-dependent enzyme